MDINDKNTQRALGRIEGKLESLISEVRRSCETNDKRFVLLENKANTLETFRDNIEGGRKEQTRIATLAGALAGGFLSAIVWIASKILKG
jgi:hypothetical protein